MWQKVSPDGLKIRKHSSNICNCSTAMSKISDVTWSKIPNLVFARLSALKDASAQKKGVSFLCKLSSFPLILHSSLPPLHHFAGRRSRQYRGKVGCILVTTPSLYIQFTAYVFIKHKYSSVNTTFIQSESAEPTLGTNSLSLSHSLNISLVILLSSWLEH